MLGKCINLCDPYTSPSLWHHVDLLQRSRSVSYKKPRHLLAKQTHKTLRCSLGCPSTCAANCVGFQEVLVINIQSRNRKMKWKYSRSVYSSAWGEIQKEAEAVPRTIEDIKYLRPMERNNHTYVALDTLHQENHCASNGEPCSSGNSDHYSGVSNSTKREGWVNRSSPLEDTFCLEHVGQVVISLSNTRLQWHRPDNKHHKLDASMLACCGSCISDTPWHLPVSEIHAVQFVGLGPVSSRSPVCGLYTPPPQGLLLQGYGKECPHGSLSPFTSPVKLHRVEVHTFSWSDCMWHPKVFLFGHSSAEVAQAWTSKIQVLLDRETHRPKKLLVFVNPYGGKGLGVKIWEQVVPFFDRAKIETTVVKTSRAGHAHDIMKHATKEELNAQDGVVVVGGDGFFNEVLNGLVLRRHKAQAATLPQRSTDILTEKTASNRQHSSHEGVPKNKDNVKTTRQEGGLKQLVCRNANADTNFSSPLTSDQDPLLQRTPLPSLSEVETAKEGKQDDSSSKALVSEGSSQGHGSLVGGDAVFLPAVVNENDLQGQANGDSPGYCSVSVTVPVRDEEGNFLNPTSQRAEPTVGVKRKGEDLVSMTGVHSDIDLEDPNGSLINSNPNLRFGIIPAGSTDTVVVSTTGTRDPITSALHIILGDNMPLDIVRVISWRSSPKDSDDKPDVRYAASFAGYGFYGDVMKESESLRWMGPARYDLAGFKVFMKHKSYDAEISFLDISHNPSEPHALKPGPWMRTASFNPRKFGTEDKKVVCRANCAICAKGFDFSSMVNSERDREGAQTTQGPPRWKTFRANFHSVGAAVMSCRNDKAPEGVAAHAHLADGLLHLILIRECSRPNYLRQLLRLARRGADPFNFKFVEHHKTPVFTFTSHGDEQSVWSVDGELVPAHQLSGQVFRGLVNLFARGPEV